MSKNLKRILIVDDEPNILMTLDFLFRKKGYDVFVARNGREAIELLDEHKPHCTLLDIMMPEVDGYEVCEYIRNSDQHKDSGVIFLSAKTKKTDVEKGFELGADAYVSKPFSTRELADKVAGLIEEKYEKN